MVDAEILNNHSDIASRLEAYNLKHFHCVSLFDLQTADHF
jgi:hypothetical protein